jgi:phosphatidylserine/phosphatidylglycerophosphate/cardiolipin synthase-like enzyme
MFTDIIYLANKGSSCQAKRQIRKYAIMHNKFIIIDSKTIETGSFNYSAAATNKNSENVAQIENAPEITGGYEKNSTNFG